MTKTMAEVLAANLCGRKASSCAECRAEGEELAAALSAAGFGLVADAGAKALEDAADSLKWVKPESACEDTEACCGSAASCDLMQPSSYAVGADWLRARAAAVRGEDAHD